MAPSRHRRDIRNESAAVDRRGSGPQDPFAQLSARERQIMAVVHRLESASARDIQDGIPDSPSYSAVRTTISILEKKGWLEHRDAGERYMYRATVPKPRTGVSALSKLVETFFGNSVEKAVHTLLSSKELECDDEELERIAKMVDEAKARASRASTSERPDPTDATLTDSDAPESNASTRGKS